MILRFTASPDFDFITQFAEQINMPIKDNLLKIQKERRLAAFCAYIFALLGGINFVYRFWH